MPGCDRRLCWTAFSQLTERPAVGGVFGASGWLGLSLKTMQGAFSCFMVGLAARQLSMNRTPSPHPSPPLGERVPEGRVRGILRGSWSQCVVAEPWRLSMNRKVGRAVLCAPTPATALAYSAKNGARGVRRLTSSNRFTAPMRVRSCRLKLSMKRCSARCYRARPRPSFSSSNPSLRPKNRARGRGTRDEDELTWFNAPMRVRCWRLKLSTNLVGDEVTSLTFLKTAKKIRVSLPRLLPICFWIRD